MSWNNSADKWGWIAVGLHWLMAVAIIAMFFMGQWMVDLDYYDTWYHKAPDLHKSIGIALFALTLLRIGWRLYTPSPKPLAHSRIEQLAAMLVHGLLYLLLLALMISGYLISTADGHGIEVFGWFEVPATLYGLEEQEDIAGEIHEALALALMGLVALHLLGALKHHFIDKDPTLKRMFGLSR